MGIILSCGSMFSCGGIICSSGGGGLFIVAKTTLLKAQGSKGLDLRT